MYAGGRSVSISGNMAYVSNKPEPKPWNRLDAFVRRNVVKPLTEISTRFACCIDSSSRNS
jgi:hypothetical protein